MHAARAHTTDLVIPVRVHGSPSPRHGHGFRQERHTPSRAAHEPMARVEAEKRAISLRGRHLPRILQRWTDSRAGRVPRQGQVTGLRAAREKLLQLHAGLIEKCIGVSPAIALHVLCAFGGQVCRG